MPRVCPSPIVALVALSLALWLPLGAAPPGDQWLRSLELGKQAVVAKSSPGIVYVYTTRALPCKTMEEQTFQDAGVGERLGGFVCIALDATGNARLADSLGIIRVPTVIFLDGTGREVDRAVGFKPPADMIRYLDRVTEYHQGRTGRDIFATSAIDITQPREGSQPFRLSLRAPAARRVQLVGDFNDWRTDDPNVLLRKHPAGTWFIDVHLTPGTYEYKFLVDGEYVTDPRNPFRRPNPFGTLNSVILLGQTTTSPLVDGRSVTFLLYDDEAGKVELASDFTNWQPVALYRNRQDRGMWGARFDVPPGRYQYKFLIDGEWRTDPLNVFPVEDGSGNINSTFTVR